MYGCAFAHMSAGIHRSQKRGFRTPGARVKGCCEHPNVGVAIELRLPAKATYLISSLHLHFITCYAYISIFKNPSNKSNP